MEIRLKNGLILSAPNAKDAETLVEHLQQEEFSRMTLRIPHPYTRAAADEYLKAVKEERLRHPRDVDFAIRLSDSRLIGCVGFQNPMLKWARRAEIGYWIAKPYWGRGLMTDVVRAMCEYGHNLWGFIRIEAGVFDFNPASARVLEKAGFQKEGVARSYFIKDGKPVDSVRYSKILLNETPLDAIERFENK